MPRGSAGRLRSWWVLSGLVVALGVGALTVLAYVVVSRAESAVRAEARGSLVSSASLTAALVGEEMRGIGEVVDSSSRRTRLREALQDPAHVDRVELDRQLRALTSSQPERLGSGGVTDPQGTVLANPLNPELVGRDVSGRDWFRGAVATGGVYISEAFLSARPGSPPSIAIATPITSEAGELLGVMVAGYTLDELHVYVAGFARRGGVEVTITDQRGVVLAQPAGAPAGLVSRAADDRVASALVGESGVSEGERPGRDDQVVSAFAPVPGTGWAVVAELPSSRAFAEVDRLRTTVLVIAIPLMLLFVAGEWFLARALRLRDRARERAERLASINTAVLETSREGMSLIGPDGVRLLDNACMQELRALFATSGANAYQEMDDLAAATTDPAAFAATAAALAADPDLEVTDEFGLADSGRWFSRYTRPVRDERGALIGRLLVLRETTAEKEANRLKEEIVGMVSHELRTPLTGILGFAELLQDPTASRDQTSRYGAVIHQEAQRLAALINDFLDLERIHAGQFTLAVQELDLAELLRGQIVLHSPPGAGHQVELHLHDEPLTVLGDPERLRQVVGNLLSNAIKYSPRGGAVDVTAERRDDVVRCTVADHGLGIPTSQHRHIFQRFYRVDSPETRKIGGTGLGLALARDLVEAHGGHIGFDSSEGHGSSFWFELPPPSRPAGAALLVEAATG